MAAETELGSSLGLQVCLYYNAVFTLPWLAGLIAVTATNVNTLTIHNLSCLQRSLPLQGYPFGSVTQTVLYAVIAACDWLRLWLGYTGNLYERVK